MHESWETLSALKDGELVAAEADRARSHLASCAECAAQYAKLGEATALFKRAGAVSMPPGLAARVKTPKPTRSLGYKLTVAVASVTVAAWIGAVALKAFMPTLFNNIQSMITGAAGMMGSGGK